MTNTPSSPGVGECLRFHQDRIPKECDGVVFNGMDVGGSLPIIICEWIEMEMNFTMFRDYKLNTDLDLQAFSGLM